MRERKERGREERFWNGFGCFLKVWEGLGRFRPEKTSKPSRTIQKYPKTSKIRVTLEIIFQHHHGMLTGASPLAGVGVVSFVKVLLLA